MKPFQVQEGALEPERARAMLEGLVRSPLVASSPLGGSFRGSRGLAFTFRRSGLPLVCHRAPGLEPFLKLAIEANPTRGFTPRWRRWLAPARLPNAFYLNLLLLEPAQAIGRHVDGTLREASGLPDVLPECVSVLYLQTPKTFTGGQLLLSFQSLSLACISPRPGTLVHFRGDLEHEVTAVQGAEPGGRRASLVCEQYWLPPQALARVPELRIHSKADFKSYLEAHQGRGNVPSPAVE